MKIISWKLWLPDHVFPQIPVIELNSVSQVILFILFFVIAVALLFRPFNTYLLLLFIVSEVITLLGDEVRWLPWSYQFLFILFCILINKRNPRLAINGIILILASTYFYSGLQKINGGFLYNVWLRLILVRFLHLSPAIYKSGIIRWAGLIIPLFEIASGLLILLPKQHKLFALFPIFVHVFILLFLSPVGINYNGSVLPWNIAMAIFIYVLFVKTSTVFSFKDSIYKGNLAITMIWIILPIAGIFGYWDKFFSSGVYTGNAPYINIYLADTSTMPHELLPYTDYSKKGFQGIHTRISVRNWCMTELKVPVPPEARIYKSIEQSFCKKYGYLQPVFQYR